MAWYGRGVPKEKGGKVDKININQSLAFLKSMGRIRLRPLPNPTTHPELGFEESDIALELFPDLGHEIRQRQGGENGQDKP